MSPTTMHENAVEMAVKASVPERLRPVQISTTGAPITANSALLSQMSTLSEADHSTLIAKLQEAARQLIDHEPTVSLEMHALAGERDLYVLRVDASLRALIRLNEAAGALEVLSVARVEQMEPWAKSLRRSA